MRTEDFFRKATPGRMAPLVVYSEDRKNVRIVWSLDDGDLVLHCPAEIAESRCRDIVARIDKIRRASCLLDLLNAFEVLEEL
jgi:hypothetical protein